MDQRRHKTTILLSQKEIAFQRKDKRSKTSQCGIRPLNPTYSMARPKGMWNGLPGELSVMQG
jgi:hypothetical protein